MASPVDHLAIPLRVLPPSDDEEVRPSTCNKIGQIAHKALQFFENTLWKFINETTKLAKRVFSVIHTFLSDMQDRINGIIKRLGIVSLISFIFSIKDTITEGFSLRDHIQNGDTEGVIFSSLSLVINPLDGLDSAITTTGALTAFEVLPSIAFFSLIALPLAFVLIGYGVVKGIYTLVRRGIELHGLPKSVVESGVEELKKYIEEKIGITDEERSQIFAKESTADLRQKEITVLKSRKKSIFTRHTDSKVYAIMQNLRAHLNSKKPDLEIANKALRDMRKIQVRKIITGSVGTAFGIANLVTLACASAFAMSPLLMPILLGIKSMASMGIHLYEKIWLTSGLEHPQFLS